MRNDESHPDQRRYDENSVPLVELFSSRVVGRVLAGLNIDNGKQSNKRLGVLTGMGRQKVGNIFNGHDLPNFSQLLRLLDALDADPEDLVAGVRRLTGTTASEGPNFYRNKFDEAERITDRRLGPGVPQEGKGTAER